MRPLFDSGSGAAASEDAQRLSHPVPPVYSSALIWVEFLAVGV